MTSLDERYSLIFHRVADGVLVIGVDGMIEQANPAAAAMLDVPLEALCSQLPRIVLKNYPALFSLLNGKETRPIDVPIARKRLAEGTSVPLASGGLIVFLRDVTEQRSLESRREALINSIAHDLRNPLAAIGGFAELVARSGELTADQTHFINRVRQTTSKLNDVMTNLTDLAWVEAGMPLQRQAIDFGALIDEVIAEFSERAKAKDISFVISIQDPLPKIVGDPLRIRQLLSQLIQNALLFSDGQTMVIIHAWGDDRELYCSVADQGFGIAEDELEMVFDRLYRSRDERVRDLPGGGIGLTLAKRIVTRHGGAISVTSTLDRGSTFTFSLPAAEVTS
jgi:signal transduction histidine kinase